LQLSPIMYPRGKSKFAKELIKKLPPNIKEFREVMLGGGGFSFFISQVRPNIKIVANDINWDLYNMWLNIQQHPTEMVNESKKIIHQFDNGKDMLYFLREIYNDDSDLKKAVKIYLLDRISYSGFIYEPYCRTKDFKSRVNDKMLENLLISSKIIKNWDIRNQDYAEFLTDKGKDIFIFLDPPYLSNKDSKFYGKNGELHTNFNHKRLANELKNCNHKWLMTYDYSEEIYEMYSWANVYIWKLPYSMTTRNKQKNMKWKEEFLITNYNVREYDMKLFETDLIAYKQ